MPQHYRSNPDAGCAAGCIATAIAIGGSLLLLAAAAWVVFTVAKVVFG